MCRARSSWQLSGVTLTCERFQRRLNPVEPVLERGTPVSVGSRLATGEERIVLPPVDSHLLRRVDGSDEEPKLDGEQLDVEQVDDDVTGDDDALVENAFEDVSK